MWLLNNKASQTTDTVRFILVNKQSKDLFALLLQLSSMELNSFPSSSLLKKKTYSKTQDGLIHAAY